MENTRTLTGFSIFRNFAQLHELYFDAKAFVWGEATKRHICYILNEVVITQFDLLKTGFEYSRGHEQLVKTFKIGEGVARLIQVYLGIYIWKTETLEMEEESSKVFQMAFNLLNIGNIALTILKPASDKIRPILIASKVLESFLHSLLIFHRNNDFKWHKEQISLIWNNLAQNVENHPLQSLVFCGVL